VKAFGSKVGEGLQENQSCTRKIDGKDRRKNAAKHLKKKKKPTKTKGGALGSNSSFFIPAGWRLGNKGFLGEKSDCTSGGQKPSYSGKEVRMGIPSQKRNTQRLIIKYKHTVFFPGGG